MTNKSYFWWILGVDFKSIRNIVVKIIFLSLVVKFEKFLVVFFWYNYHMDSFIEREFHGGQIKYTAIFTFDLVKSFFEIVRQSFNAYLKLLDLLLLMNEPWGNNLFSFQSDSILFEDLNQYSKYVYLEISSCPFDFFRKAIYLLLVFLLDNFWRISIYLLRVFLLDNFWRICIYLLLDYLLDSF